MRIVLLPSVEGDVIAWEESYGEREGRFLLMADGSVVHRNIWDDGECYAGGSNSQFRAAAEAWNAYTEAVLGVSEAEQEAAVDRLRGELIRLGAISGPEQSLWDLLLEQAEAGML